MLIKIIVDDAEHEVTATTLRRILNAARFHITMLENNEGGLPVLDHRALHFINVLQFDHKELL